MPARIGLDFGTTNTVAASADGAGGSIARAFRHDGETLEACRSVLCIWRDEDAARSPERLDVGPWGIDRYLELGGDCRFIQSFKTFAASALFTTTQIQGRSWRFEDLLAAFLRNLGERSGAAWPKEVVMGRPVRFAGADPDEALAQTRYESALRRLGFETIHHVHEPVAAAFFFAKRLDRAATILVADFGGGTSDFSIIRFRPGRHGPEAEALASRGIGIAGDAFDRHIIDQVVAPLFGKGGSYAADGKVLPLPQRLYARFAQWNQLSIMRHTRDYQELVRLARDALEPAKLTAFIRFLDAEASYPLYRAVAQVKSDLSSRDATVFAFDAGGVRLRQPITRAAFESWIGPDLDRIDDMVGQTLDAAGLDEGGIDRVFLTGGTSFVPAVQRRFARRFSAERVETGDQFVSIAHGLALIGEEPDIAAWTVRAG